MSQTQAHLTGLAERLEQAYPEFNKNWTIHLEPLRDALFHEAKTPLLVLLAAVVMLLSVACANVANLLLARYSSRSQEIALRASLGAGRWRVVRQLLTESMLLGAAGGLFGVTFARWAVGGLVALAPEDLSEWRHPRGLPYGPLRGHPLAARRHFFRNGAGAGCVAFRSPQRTARP